jgi:DNA-binding HxlR family transcriptional regulator
MSEQPLGLNVLDPICPSRLTLELIADKWAMLVIVALASGVIRNGDLLRKIPDISQKMLTQTLRSLEHSGLVQRYVFQQVPPKVEYKLTALGESILAPIAALRDWAYMNYDKVLQAQQTAKLHADEST